MDEDDNRVNRKEDEYNPNEGSIGLAGAMTGSAVSSYRAMDQGTSLPTALQPRVENSNGLGL